MKYHFPDYYTDFTCIGGKCPDTCCAGWNIEIDGRSLADYHQMLQQTASAPFVPGITPEFARQLRQAVDFKRKTFRLSGRRCTLLNHDNLCDLYIHAGQDSLCRTCRTYPRHQEEFGNLREISLSLSCPEAARIILNQPGRPITQTKTTEKHCPKGQEVNCTRLQWLLNARDLLLDLLWQPLPLPLAASMVLAFAHDLQRRYPMLSNQEETAVSYGELQRLACRYLAPDSAAHFCRQRQKRLASAKITAASRRIPAFTSLYQETEPIIPQWPQLLHHCEETPFQPEHAPQLPSRNLITYYLQAYFLGAIYDDDLWGKVVFAILSWLMTFQLSHALPEANGLDSFTRAAYLCSRQVENHDPNLEHILYAGALPEFKLPALLNLLA